MSLRTSSQDEKYVEAVQNGKLGVHLKPFSSNEGKTLPCAESSLRNNAYFGERKPRIDSIRNNDSLVSRLSPRVKPGVELSILRPSLQGLPMTQRTQSYNRGRTPEKREGCGTRSRASPSPVTAVIPATPTITDNEQSESDTNGSVTSQEVNKGERQVGLFFHKNWRS